MSQESPLRERVVQLEELLSHHQRLVEQLNQVTLTLQSDVEALQAQANALTRQIEVLTHDQSPVDDRPEKPPHY